MEINLFNYLLKSVTVLTWLRQKIVSSLLYFVCIYYYYALLIKTIFCHFTRNAWLCVSLSQPWLIRLLSRHITNDLINKLMFIDTHFLCRKQTLDSQSVI